MYSVGFEDYSQIAIDIDKKDGEYAPKRYESLRGIRMPDGISLITIGGVDYLLTANEGDSGVGCGEYRVLLPERGRAELR